MRPFRRRGSGSRLLPARHSRPREDRFLRHRAFVSRAVAVRREPAEAVRPCNGVRLPERAGPARLAQDSEAHAVVPRRAAAAAGAVASAVPAAAQAGAVDSAVLAAAQAGAVASAVPEAEALRAACAAAPAREVVRRSGVEPAVGATSRNSSRFR